MPVRELTQELVETHRAAGFWPGRPLYAVVDQHAAMRPHAPALADQHERMTYAEFVRRSHALADHLLGLGLRPGDAVALQSPNRNAIGITHLACDRSDLVFVPLSTAWRHRELSHLLAMSRARVLVVPQAARGVDYMSVIDDLRPGLPELAHLGSLDGLAPGADFDFDEVTRRRTGVVVVDRDPEAPRFVMVTSGTTDLPRLAQWTDDNLWFFMRSLIDSVALTSEDIAVGLCPANTGATGYVFPVLGPLLVGASSILLEEWSPRAALNLMQDERATTATAIPTQVMKMLQEPDLGDRDFTSLRLFTNSGAAMPPQAAQEVETVFGCTSHVIYGSTDGGVPSMTRVDDPVGKRLTSVGRLLRGTDLRLVDPLGEQVAVGEPGEICWRSPTKSFGYLNEPERTDAAFDADGYYHSGDLGRIDGDGYLFVTGRVKDLIIRGGQNISPQELEIVLARHPSVSEVSVIGTPDAVYGERVCACVTCRPGRTVDVADLAAFLLSEGVAKFKLPERVEVFDELPKSAGGKISKVELRAAVGQRSAAELSAPGG